MTFATILQEAGISSEMHEKIAQISITLFDGKDRKIMNEDIHFVEPLFKNNPSAYKQFQSFLAELEKRSDIQDMKVKIDEYAVIVFYKNPFCRIFLRNALDPMDYMD